MIKRIFNKIKRLAYYYSHPFLWGKNVQINGIPTIGNPKSFHLGKHVSLNDRCYIQSVGGGKIRKLCDYQLWCHNFNFRIGQ